MQTTNIVVKYIDGIDLSRAAAELPLPENAHNDWQSLVESVGGSLSIRRLFAQVNSEQLAALVALARLRTAAAETHLPEPAYTPPVFANFLWVSFRDDTRSDEDRVGFAAKLADEFLGWAGVEYAYVRLPDRPASVAPRRSTRRSTRRKADAQSSPLGAAPGGINAAYLWTLPGGAGAGQQLIDIEWGWYLQHKALLNARGQPRAKLSSTRGAPMASNKDWAHGTAVLGLVCAGDTGSGTVGIAPAISGIEAVSVWGADDSAAPLAEAVLSAAARRVATALAYEASPTRERERPASPTTGTISLNTVILIEMESQLVGQAHCFPVEIYPDTFVAIELITRAGLTVIEPAGNGVAIDTHAATAAGRWGDSPPPAVDLDALEKFVIPALGLPPNLRSLNPQQQSASTATQDGVALAEFADSGAVMVAAVVNDAPRAMRWKRQFNSNFGSRIDCFAQGENVYALTYDGNNADARYQGFGGTSAAAAIIAGAALCVQGFAQASAQGLLASRALRSLLSDQETGTRCDASESAQIGVMPNLTYVSDQVKKLAQNGLLIPVGRGP